MSPARDSLYVTKLLTPPAFTFPLRRQTAPHFPKRSGMLLASSNTMPVMTVSKEPRIILSQECYTHTGMVFMRSQVGVILSQFERTMCASRALALM